MLVDGASPRGRIAITDAYGNGGLALHKPGFRVIADSVNTVAQRQAIQDAYADAERALTSMWRGNHFEDSKSCNPRSSGRNPPLRSQNDSASIRDAIEQAHQEHRDYLET